MYAAKDPDIRIADIQSETIDTCELGYIYRNVQTVGRLTLFYSDIKARTEDMLTEPERFYSSGAELELERPLIRDVLKFDGNLSYTNTRSRDADREIPEAADWLANAGLIYRPSRSLLFALQYYYVGDREGYDGEHISGYHTADFALNIFNLGIEGLTLRAGVKNIFEEDVRYYSSRPGEGDCLDGDSSGDLDESDSGRWWWIKISYEF
jgi:iron complex outermembrane receptor protein